MADVIIVGCKLPHGLEIQLGGKTVLLNGNNSTDIVGGYGLTYDVDKAAFDQWLLDYKDFPAVQQGLIFAQTTDQKAKSQAKEQAAVKTGLEGLNPDAPAPGIQPDPDQAQKV